MQVGGRGDRAFLLPVARLIVQNCSMVMKNAGCSCAESEMTTGMSRAEIICYCL
jgi:hypothetical protein